MNEEWRDIPGYEGRYQVSNMGNVRSLNYANKGFVKELKHTTLRNGYKTICLRVDGKHYTHTTHKLVAKAFLDNPNMYECVNHKDENKTNNRADNLEWFSLSYNARYFYERHPENLERIVNNIVSTNKARKGKWKQKASKFDGIEIEQVLNGDVVARTSDIVMFCKPCNWQVWSIINVCEGRQTHAYGYTWRCAKDNTNS